ncbi:helix-turn-helix domain-containing protein [Nocardia sp. NPDC050378]|uniref:TetR/AcrR family transcriptional regulator n=1 Tax=Nocardia sp. NPDC050378 TaxID=3155400 RepID=UPI0034007F55
MTPSTRERIMTEALRLFGEQGFAKTSVAQIERAAGLSSGAGGLYRHFRSKDELLVEAVSSRLSERGALELLMAPDFSITAALAPAGSLVDKLTALCRIGLDRIDHDRDVNRILMRDNSVPADMLEVFRQQEYGVVMPVVTRGLAELAGTPERDQDWEATAAVLVGAIAHFWLIRDIFDGDHPANVEAEGYLRATAEMIAARLEWVGNEEEQQ